MAPMGSGQSCRGDHAVSHTPWCALGALAVFCLTGTSAQPPPMPDHQLPPRAPCCPQQHIARNIALGYLHSTWVRQRCLGPFEEAALGYDLQQMQGFCRFTIRRPLGDLAVLIDDNLDVRQGLMRLDAAGPWRPIDAAVCSRGTFVGLADLQNPVLPQEEISFAFEAIVAERIRLDVVGRGCGATLHLESSNATVQRVRVQSLQQVSEHSFTIQVTERDRPDVVIPVEVRLMRKANWQGEDRFTQSAYAFIRTVPAPCDISSAPLRRLSPAASSASGRTGESPPPPAAATEEASGRYVSRHLEFLQLSSLPSEYCLFRDRPACAKPAQGHGFCGSSWAFAAVGAFEKQLCRLSDRPVPEVLSRQWPLSCAVRANGCDGGSLQEVHAALLEHGAVTQDCVAYISGPTHSISGDPGSPDGNPLGSSYCREAMLDGCAGRRFYARDPDAYEWSQSSAMLALSSVSSGTQWLSGERAISTAILSYGAVATMLDVFADLYAYTGGVYQRSSRDFQGRTAVQLLGWGVEPSSGVTYWVAEASWGPKWGENQQFGKCSIQDCRGEFCPDDNGNPNCFDSTSWTDRQGYNCAWYTQNDPGCAIYKDVGQRANCNKSCKTCASPALSPGEWCGFFRILRGQNHCGVEALASHAFAMVYSASVEETPAGAAAGSAASCADRGEWNDGFGRGCSWYAGRGCQAFPDVGQLYNCPTSCNTCGAVPRVSQTRAGWAMAGPRVTKRSDVVPLPPAAGAPANGGWRGFLWAASLVALAGAAIVGLFAVLCPLLRRCRMRKAGRYGSLDRRQGSGGEQGRRGDTGRFAYPE